MYWVLGLKCGNCVLGGIYWSIINLNNAKDTCCHIIPSVQIERHGPQMQDTYLYELMHTVHVHVGFKFRTLFRVTTSGSTTPVTEQLIKQPFKVRFKSHCDIYVHPDTLYQK